MTPPSWVAVTSTREPQRLRPLHLVVAVLCLLPVVVAARPIDDPDAFWHVVLGEEIIRTGNVTGIGDTWAWYDPDDPWTTSQWLSEVAMALVVESAGWAGLVWATIVVVGIVAAAIAALVLTLTRSAVGVVVVAVGMLGFSLVVEARPLMLSLLGTTLVSHWAARLLYTGRVPSTWWALLVVLWANLHGQWVIAPLAVGLATVLYWLDDPTSRRRLLVRGIGVSGLLALAGCLSPLGIWGLLLPFLLRENTNHIVEWQRLEPLSIAAIPLVLLLVIIVWGWLRIGRRPVRSEAVYVAFWTVFALPAERNVMVSLLFLLPVAAVVGARAFPESGQSRARTDRRLFRFAGAASALATVVLLTIAATRFDPLAEARAIGAAERLAAAGSAVRVLNDYNVAGVLVAFGPSGIELGIDGRAERYGAEYIDAYLDALALRGDGWEEFLAKFEPEAAVIEARAPIRHVLEDDWDWELVMRDGDYVLLEPRD